MIIKGWKNIAAFFGRDERGFRSKKRVQELKSGGFVFYQWERRGRNRTKVVCAFSESLIRYTAIKANKGETI